MVNLEIIMPPLVNVFLDIMISIKLQKIVLNVQLYVKNGIILNNKIIKN